MIWKRWSFILLPERAGVAQWGVCTGCWEEGTGLTGPGLVLSSVFRMWSTCSCRWRPLPFITDKCPVSLSSSTSLTKSRTVSSGWTSTPAEGSSCQVRPLFPGARFLLWGTLYPLSAHFPDRSFLFLGVLLSAWSFWKVRGRVTHT